MRYRLKQIHCRPWTLSYLSVPLIESHYENNYGGAVKRLNLIEEQNAELDYAKATGFVINGLKREQLIAMNSMILHELFFDGLGEQSEPGSVLQENLAKDLSDRHFHGRHSVSWTSFDGAMSTGFSENS